MRRTSKGQLEQWRLRVRATMLLVALALPCVASAHAQPEFIIGIFPRMSAVVTHEQYDAFAHYLSAVLGRPVRLETAKDFESFWSGVKADRYDLIHYNQYQYVKSHKEFGHVVIAKNKEYGKETIAPIIVVRGDSGIDRIAQLKGRKVIFGGGRTAMVSYIAAKAMLQDAGLRDGDVIEEFAMNPINTVMAMYIGQADAATSADIGLSSSLVVQRIDVAKLKTIGTGADLPQLPWAVRKDTPPKVAEQLAATLSELDATAEGRTILAKAQLTGFARATDSEYDGCRALIKRVLGEDYGGN